MTRSASSLLLVVAVLGIAGACKNPFQKHVLCTTSDVFPAITVAARDSVTGGYVGAGTKIIARDGSVMDSVTTTVSSQPVGLFWERAGTYDVTVQKTGYQTWTKTGVHVTADECHVQTVALVARLQK